MNGHRVVPVFLYSKKKSVPLVTPVLDTGAQVIKSRRAATQINIVCADAQDSIHLDPAVCIHPRKLTFSRGPGRGMTSKENAGHCGRATG